jgi:hypothetical protein
MVEVTLTVDGAELPIFIIFNMKLGKSWGIMLLVIVKSVVGFDALISQSGEIESLSLIWHLPKMLSYKLIVTRCT